MRWFSWRDAQSGESYGESTLYEVAVELARRVAGEPLVEGRARSVDLYEEPGGRLLARYRGQEEESVASPSAPKQPKARAGRPGLQGGSADKRRLHELQELHDLVVERDELARRRRRAGLPEDAWRVVYLVVEGEDGTPLGWTSDEAEARAMVALAAKLGHRVTVRESLDWALVSV